MTRSAPFSMLIGERAVDGGDRLDVINPATEEVIAQVPDCGRDQLDDAIAAARSAFSAWRKSSNEQRREALGQIAAALVDNAAELRDLLTAEQGKPLAAAQGEIDATAFWIGEMAKYELPVTTTDEMPGLRSVTTREPLGVVGAIVPWNFPLLLASWKICPALLAGNTLVLKPAPTTPLATLRWAEYIAPHLPAGVLNVVTGGDRLGPWMTAHEGVDKISFTGSTATGKRVMESAAGNLKRVTLELGGNDAAIVLDDVDVARVAEPLFWAAFTNSGQVCVAAKRIYVHEDVYDEVLSALTEIARNVQVGDGTSEGAALGPVQNRAQYRRVSELLRDARECGLALVEGAKASENKGFFVPMTLVDNPPESASVVQEEAFGPVVPLMRYRDLEEVIAKANASPYGLAGSVWSSDVERARAIAQRLETGTVWVNSAQNLTPYAAFAGHKASGLGTEQGLDGLLEYTVPKTIHVPREDA